MPHSTPLSPVRHIHDSPRAAPFSYYTTQITFEELLELINTTKWLVVNGVAVKPPHTVMPQGQQYNVEEFDERPGVLRTVVMLEMATLCAFDQVIGSGFPNFAHRALTDASRRRPLLPPTAAK